MCSRVSWCIGRSYFTKHFKSMCSDLDQSKKNFIDMRYIRLVKNLEESTKRSALFYYLFSSLVTTGSILIPSLITIQDRAFRHDATEMDQNEHSNTIYWVVWGISIAVTLSNAFIKLLRLDQTYISRNLRLNQLRSEGVMFLSSVGDYELSNQDQKFRKFVDNVEKIKNMQMYQEFTQNGEFERNNNTNSIFSRSPQQENSGQSTIL
jgi:hypothetical protein